MKIYAYHFTYWIAHAGVRKYMRGISDPGKRASLQQGFLNIAGKSFLKVIKAGKLRVPQPDERCAAQDIELLAGDDRCIWCTLDPSFFGFTKRMEPWSFGFIYDAEILIREFGGCVRVDDYLNDYTSFLKEVLINKAGYKRLSDDPKSIWTALESLPEKMKKYCAETFKKQAKTFRKKNELKADAALDRLKVSPQPAEIVIRKALPVDIVEAYIIAGYLVQRKTG